MSSEALVELSLTNEKKTQMRCHQGYLDLALGARTFNRKPMSQIGSMECVTRGAYTRQACMEGHGVQMGNSMT